MSYIDVLTNQQIYPSPNSYVLIDDNNVTAADPVYLDWPSSQTVGDENHFALSLRVDVNIDTEPLVIVLPDAMQASVGQPVYINNIGTEPVSVVGNDGTTIMGSVTSGHCYWFTLTDQSTPTGVWTYVDVAAGTSTPDAAALAGYGLTTLTSNTKLNTNDNIVFLNSNSVLDITYRGKLIVWQGGVGTITLPNPNTTDVGNGFYVMINNESTIGGYVNVINPYGNIDLNASSSPVSLQIGSSGQFVSDGVTDYYTFGLGFPTFYTFAVLNLNVTGLFNVSNELTLTAEQAARQILNLSGSIGADSTIIFPATPNQYYIQSLVTGAYNLYIEMAGGTPLLLPYNTRVIAICDGTNLYYYPDNQLSATKFILQQPSSFAPAGQALSLLTTGIMKSTTTTGVVSIAVNGTDYFGPGIPLFIEYEAVPSAKAGGTYLTTSVDGITFTNVDYDLYLGASDDNIVVNSGALPSAVSAARNTILGAGTGLDLTTGDDNVIIGSGAGAAITTGNSSIIIGSQAGELITTLNSVVLIGFAAGASLTTGGDSATMIGTDAGLKTTTGNSNTFVGYAAGYSNTIAWSNTYLGRVAGYNNDVGYYNTCMGDSAGYYNVGGTGCTYLGFEAGSGAATYKGESNIGIGYQAMSNILGTSTDNNIAIGTQAGNSLNNGSYNVLLGALAGTSITSATNVVAIGQRALANHLTGLQSIAIGSEAGYNNKTGNYNIFIGSAAGYTNTASSGLICIGTGAGGALTTATAVTIVGYQAGDAITTGSNTTLMGSAAGGSLTTATDSTFVGANTGALVTTVSGLTFVGSNVGAAVTSGSNLTIMGSYAGSSITTGNQSVLVGDKVGFKMTTDSYATIIGSQAGALLNGTSENTYVGALAGVYSTTCNLNTFLGSNAGKNTDTGGKNLILGAQSGLTLNSGTNNVIAGYNADVKAVTTSNSVAIGSGATVLGDDVFALGNGQNVIQGYNAANGASSIVNAALELQSTTSTTPASVYMAPTGTVVHTQPSTGGTVCVNAYQDSLGYYNKYGFYYVDTNPQPYFDVQMDWDALAPGANVLNNAPASPAVYFPFSVVSSNLTSLLQGGYPGGFYPNAVVTVEASVFFEFSITPLEYYIDAKLYKLVGATYTEIAGVTVNQQYKFRNTSSFQQMSINVKVNCLLTDIVDASATEWGIAFNNVTPYAGSPDLAYVVGSANVQNAYLITGGIT